MQSLFVYSLQAVLLSEIGVKSDFISVFYFSAVETLMVRVGRPSSSVLQVPIGIHEPVPMSGISKHGARQQHLPKEKPE